MSEPKKNLLYDIYAVTHTPTGQYLLIHRSQQRDEPAHKREGNLFNETYARLQSVNLKKSVRIQNAPLLHFLRTTPITPQDFEVQLRAHDVLGDDVRLAQRRLARRLGPERLLSARILGRHEWPHPGFEAIEAAIETKQGVLSWT